MSESWNAVYQVRPYVVKEDQEGLTAELVCAEAVALPWQAECFDAKFAFQVIHHQRMQAIRQSFR